MVNNARNTVSLKIFSSKTLYSIVFLLTALGLVAVADVSAPLSLKQFGDRYFFVKQQFTWLVIGVLISLVVSKINFSFWERFATLLFIFSLILLVLVIIPGIGSEILGARRWIILAGFSIQPSELIKLTSSIYFAKLVSKNKSIASFTIPLILIVILIMLQPDLGTALIVMMVGFAAIYLSEIKIIKLLFVLLSAMSFALISIISSDYRRLRLMDYLKSFSDPMSSYHLRQVLLAIGVGGFFGAGIGMSKQKYLFVPESASDSIFAIVAEEIGFFGSLILIMLFVFLIFNLISLSRKSKTIFGSIFTTLVSVWIASQLFLNLGSMLAIVPLTGVPMPFFSYGGSSLISLLVAIGIVKNINNEN